MISSFSDHAEKANSFLETVMQLTTSSQPIVLSKRPNTIQNFTASYGEIKCMESLKPNTPYHPITPVNTADPRHCVTSRPSMGFKGAAPNRSARVDGLGSQKFAVHGDSFQPQNTPNFPGSPVFSSTQKTFFTFDSSQFMESKQPLSPSRSQTFHYSKSTLKFKGSSETGPPSSSSDKKSEHTPRLFDEYSPTTRLHKSFDMDGMKQATNAKLKVANRPNTAASNRIKYSRGLTENEVQSRQAMTAVNGPRPFKKCKINGHVQAELYNQPRLRRLQPLSIQSFRASLKDLNMANTYLQSIQLTK